jgi:hypothetical protein
VVQEAKLHERSCATSDTDLIFTRVKTRGELKIDYHQFKQALYLIAEKKGESFGAVVDMVVGARAPQ